MTGRLLYLLLLILALVNVESRQLISKRVLRKHEQASIAWERVGEECKSANEEAEGVCTLIGDCPEVRKIENLHQDHGCIAGEVCCKAEAHDLPLEVVPEPAPRHVGIETDMIDFGELYHCNLMFFKYFTAKQYDVTFYPASDNEKFDYSQEDIILINSHGSYNGKLVGNKLVNWFFKSQTYKPEIKYWVFACFIKEDSSCFEKKDQLVGKELMGFLPGLIINSCYQNGEPGFLVSLPSNKAGYVEAFKAAYGMHNPTEENLWALEFEPRWPTTGPKEMDVSVLHTLLEKYENLAGSRFISLDEIFGDQI